MVRLEPLTPEHLEPLCAVGLDPELWRWISHPVEGREGMRRWLEEALAEMAAGRALAFATIERSSRNVAGSSRFGNVVLRHRRLEIGWTWVARPWQRTAVNTEAKLLMLTHAFEELGCLRVELKTDRLNERSRRAILRLGAREEGVLRQHIVCADGRRRDTVYFSVLAEEWPEVRARLERKLAGGAAGPGPAA